MRWPDKKYILRDRVGEERDAMLFLWLPRLLDNPKLNRPEWRWLEHTWIRQKIEEVGGGYMDYYAGYLWVDKHWAEEK